MWAPTSIVWRLHPCSLSLTKSSLSYVDVFLSTARLKSIVWWKFVMKWDLSFTKLQWLNIVLQLAVECTVCLEWLRIQNRPGTRPFRSTSPSCASKLLQPLSDLNWRATANKNVISLCVCVCLCVPEVFDVVLEAKLVEFRTCSSDKSKFENQEPSTWTKGLHLTLVCPMSVLSFNKNPRCYGTYEH